MTNDNSEQRQPKNWLDQTLLLAVAPALGYFFAFRYEAGYCSTFSLPDYLVKPELTTILILTTIVLSYSGILLFFFDRSQIVANLKPWQRLLGRYFPLLVLVMFSVLIYGRFWRPWMPPILLFLSYVTGNLVASIREPKEKAFIERLANGPSALFSPFVALDILKERCGLSAVKALLFFLIGTWMAYAFGNAQALHQREFLVPSTQTNAVVVRLHGDNFICVEYDVLTKKPTRKFFIMPISADKGIQYELRKVGPLCF